MPIFSAVKSLASKLRSAGAWSVFHVLRVCEQALPISFLGILLWFPAAFWDLCKVRPRRLLSCWRAFPFSLRPEPGAFLRRQLFGFSHSRLIYSWPDRLGEKHWLKRCRLEGRCDIAELCGGERGIVFASLHFGPFETFPYWLRAYGVVTTMIRGLAPPASLQSLTSHQYELSPPEGVPVFYLAQDMTPVPRFAHIRRVLGPGRRMLVMVDAERGIQVRVPLADRSLRMATGAIQLAAMAQADLIPCLIAVTGPWRFAIHFGEKVPREYLENPDDLEPITSHLVREFTNVLAQYPEQSRARLLSAFSGGLDAAHSPRERAQQDSNLRPTD